MAKAYVSYHPVELRSPHGSSVLGIAAYSDVLDFSGGIVWTSSALSAEMADNRRVVTLITVDADCFVAVGTQPNCNAQVASETSSARVFLAAGATLDLLIPVGCKVGALAVADAE